MAATSYSICVFFTLLVIVSVTGTVKDCPPWSTWDNSTAQCVCSDTMELVIMCNEREQRSFLRLGFCAIQDSTTNHTVVADCPYVFPDHLILGGYISLPNKSSELNHFMCGSLNREIGTPLCGRCTNGTGPSIYSAGSQCVSCSAVNIVYYLLLQYLPITILYVAVIVFKLNITSAPMVHYVLFCNGIVMYFKTVSGANSNILHTKAYKYVSIPEVFLLTLNALWTLDTLLFVSPALCVSKHMEEIYIPFLDTIASLYPFILLLVTYVGIELHAHDFKPVVHLWRFIHRPYIRFRRTWDPNASVIQAFATLFFLSYTKFIQLMYEALFISVVINDDGKVVSRVSHIDPTVSILISLSVLILVIIIIPPLLLLIVFPTRLFRKISTCLKPRWIVSIQTFVDTFYGCYKDGTNGTRDYRAVSGYILAIWAFLPAVVIAAKSQESRVQFLTHIILIVVSNSLSVAFALLKPYKHRIANISVVIISAVIVLANALAILFPQRLQIKGSTTVATLTIILLSLPHCVFYGYIVYRLGKMLKQYCCKKREMVDSVNEQTPCRLANCTGYSQLSEVSCQESKD